ncbi:MAG: hypothetical protein ACPG51_17755 [Thiolinea sp.]
MALFDGLKDAGGESPGVYPDKATGWHSEDSIIATTDYQQRVITIDAGNAMDGYVRGIDPWHLLNDLRLQSEDKNFLRGAVSILPLSDSMLYAFLMTYKAKWEVAAQRCVNPNGKTNAGRRAANSWILYGAKPFIQWEDSS